MPRLLLILTALLLAALVRAQVTIPNSFVNGTVVVRTRSTPMSQLWGTCH
jgi:hypothetical protein